MGAWGSGPFENDDALDWVGEFLEAPEGEGDDEAPGQVDLLGGTLMCAADKKGGYDAPAAAVGIAAAEVIAALHGKPCRALAEKSEEIEDLADWIARGTTPDRTPLVHAKVRELARRAVERALKGSELAELWADADEGAEWKKGVEDLRARLS